MSLTRALYYIVMQCLGAICGAGVVKGFQPKQYQALGGGANIVAHGYTKGSGLGAEIIGTSSTNAQQPKLFVGMILILIFVEAISLCGLIVVSSSHLELVSLEPRKEAETYYYHHISYEKFHVMCSFSFQSLFVRLSSRHIGNK